MQCFFMFSCTVHHEGMAFLEITFYFVVIQAKLRTRNVLLKTLGWNRYSAICNKLLWGRSHFEFKWRFFLLSKLSSDTPTRILKIKKCHYVMQITLGQQKNKAWNCLWRNVKQKLNEKRVKERYKILTNENTSISSNACLLFCIYEQ